MQHPRIGYSIDTVNKKELVIAEISNIAYFINCVNGKNISHRKRGLVTVEYKYDCGLYIDYQYADNNTDDINIHMIKTNIDNDMWYNEYCGQSFVDDCRRRFPNSVKINIYEDCFGCQSWRLIDDNKIEDEYFNNWCLPKWADDHKNE